MRVDSIFINTVSIDNTDIHMYDTYLVVIF